MTVRDNVIICGDCLEELPRLERNSVDLVFGSPPYEDARTYGIDFNLKGQAWVDWMVAVFRESLRVCKGLVAFVVEGKTKNYRWSATPVLLMADLHRAGICLRKPPAFHRVGIPGSGGPDWLRNDYEFIICATSGGKLPWSDNTVMGHPPKYAPGGEMSHRLSDGSKVNQWGSGVGNKSGPCAKNGRRMSYCGKPSHRIVTKKSTPSENSRRKGEKGNPGYDPPVLANPGNVITCRVGGGALGSPLAHENEAPFPESLAEFFMRSFCPPGGVVLDPVCGSGTTLVAAEEAKRRWLGIDIRQSQVDLSNKRIAEMRGLFAGASK